MNTVYDIPTGILTCLSNEKEYSILEISKTHVVVRLSENKELVSMCFCAFMWEKQDYEIFGPFDVCLIDTFTEEFYTKQKYEIKNTDFEKLFDKVISQYQSYIMLKLESDDNYFSKKLVNYPYEEHVIFGTDYDEWKNKPEKTNGIKKLSEAINALDLELAFSLETPELINRFINGNLKSIFNKDPDRIYIGNAFCHNLFPDNDLLKRALDFGKENGLGITIVFTYLRESLLLKEKEKIDFLYKWCVENDLRIEIEINDFGYLELLKNYDNFDLLFGRLINKRRKDPRYKYKAGWDKLETLQGENSVNDDGYYSFLKKLNIKRFEMESCGYEIKMIPGQSDLHLPFFQTNTSQYCPLYALCKNGDRGKQEFVTDCPGYCNEKVIMYPDHLNMIGRFNSLFALDTKIMEKTELLNHYYKKGLNRVVWNMW